MTNIVSQPPHALPLPVSHDCSGSCACGVEPLAHPKYSFGMLLEARHLELEHRYAAQRLNTHDIRLHDFGTVCGLRVIKHPSPDCVNSYAILQPGIALDCCGREIVVPETLFVPLFDGARNGWCGAPQSIAQTPPAGQKRTTLYVYLAYQQCDTDPIPTYVRACGCCELSCEHGNCVPSVTREGYTILVSSTPPPVWRNPVGAAYCDWLATQLNGPGVSAQGYQTIDKTLDQVLCDVVTEPCADFCSGNNEWLLLATVTFTPDDLLASIDNCTNRRLVLSTGAIVEAIACLTTAVTNCCKTKDAYLTLAGTVAPVTVNVEAPPATPSLTYTLSVQNADASMSAAAFSIDLTFPAGVTFASAALTIDGVAQPDPTANAGGVSAPVAALAAGKAAQVVVTASYVPAQEPAGSALAATASIGMYAGPHDANLTLTTTFTDVRVDGPRVVIKDLPATVQLADLASLLRAGVPLPFTAAMNPASASIADPASTDVFLEAVIGATVTELQVAMTWSNANSLLTLAMGVTAGGADPLQALAAQVAASGEPASVRLRLLGGPKGLASTPGPALTDAGGLRLDGDPPQGGPPAQVAGQSGNGEQGGDFVWNIAIVLPPPVDGPHVKWKAAKLPSTMSFPVAQKQFAPKGVGVNVLFDAAMDTALPPDGQVATPIVTLAVNGTNVPALVAWKDASTLNLNGAQPQMETAMRSLGNGGTITFTLAGGPKDPAQATTPVMQSADGRRLDGSPSNGAGTFASAGLSGDGHQGGDFTWTITVAAG